MHPHATARRYPAALALSLSVAALLAALAAAAPAPKPPTGVRLTNLVKVTVSGLEVNAVAMLPDNQSVVLVGGKPRPPCDADWVDAEAPAAGAIVNLRTCAVRPFTNGHKERIQRVTVTDDGSRIATTCSHREPFLRIWDVKKAATLAPVKLPAGENSPSQYELAFLPGGLKLAVGCEGCVALLDPTGREWRLDLKGGTLDDDDTPDNLAVSPDGKSLACSTYGAKVVVWDVQKGKAVHSVALLPTGGDAREWHLGELAFSRDGKGLLVSRWGKADEIPKGTAEADVPAERRSILRIDVGTGKVTPLGMGHQIHTLGFVLNPTGEWLATVGPSRPDKPGKDSDIQLGELRVYHYPTRTLALRLQFEKEFFPSRVHFTPDGKKLVAVDGGGMLRCWDFVGGKK